MGMTINNLPVADALTDNDKLDAWQYASGTDVGVPLSLLKNYLALTTNGRCRGNWPADKALTAATGDDIGVWKWAGTETGFPYTYAMVEILRHENSAGTDNNYDLVQRLNVGDAVYQRFKSGTTSAHWSTLKRFDTEYEVKAGSATYDGSYPFHVSFSDATINPGPFIASSSPYIYVTPINPANDHAFSAQVGLADGNGFDVVISHFQAPKSNEILGQGAYAYSVTLSGDTQSGYTLTSDFQGLESYINTFGKGDTTTSCAFYWMALAPKTVSGS